jgi:WD40 repeat protein
VHGNILLSGGTLVLDRNLSFNNITNINNPGLILANYNTLSLPENVGTFTIAQNGLAGSVFLQQFASDTTSNPVDAVDWLFDNSYVIAGTNYTSGQSNIITYSVNGMTLTAVGNISAGSTVYSVAGHPSMNYVAIGCASFSGNEVQVYAVNKATGGLTLTGSASIGSCSYSCWAVCWHTSGNYLIAGTDNPSEELVVYSFNKSTGAISLLSSYNITPDVAIERNSLSFCPGGNFLAAGSTANTNNDLWIFPFNGTLSAPTATLNLDLNIERVDWCPTGTYLALATNGGTQTILIYSYNPITSTLTKISSAQINDTVEEETIAWSPDGNYLAS